MRLFPYVGLDQPLSDTRLQSGRASWCWYRITHIQQAMPRMSRLELHLEH